MLSVAVLGAPRMERDGAPVEVDTRKATALLAYLALTGTDHGRDTLAGLLWPEYPQGRARAALRRTLSVLNKGTNGEVLVLGRTSIGLSRPNVDLDVDRFSRLVAEAATHGHPGSEACADCVAPLTAAAALHRGPFLAGFALRDSPEFDSWQAYQAEGLTRALATVLERLVSARVAVGDAASAIEDARRWLALDPLHEPAHQRLMQLYSWTGQLAAAVRQYRECVSVLDRELGVPPLPETTALYDAIQASRGDVVTRAPTPATPPAGDVVRPPRYPLVGRDTECAELTAAMHRATGDGVLIVVAGEPGVGKTRLAEDVLGSIDDGTREIVRVRCHEGESGLPFGVLRAVLAPAIRLLPDLDATPAHALNEVSRLLPDIASLRPGLTPPPPLESAGARARMFDAVVTILATATRSGRLAAVFVDDVHWADETSREVLAYVVRRLRDVPLTLVVTWRSEHVPRTHPLRLMATAARRDGLAVIRELARLDTADVATLVEHALPGREPDLAVRLWAETEGLPFFVIEYLDELRRSGTTSVDDWDLPTSVRDLLALRLASVSGAAAQVLSAAAVIGRTFDADVVRQVAGRSVAETLASLDGLLERGLVREIAEAGTGVAGFDFSHEKLRALVYDDTSLARRRLLHRRAAAALQRARVPGELAVVADHLQRAGDNDEAAIAFAAAAAHARSLYAHAEALQHLAAALAHGHPQPAVLHEAVGDVQTWLGAYDEAIAAYEAAAAGLEGVALATAEHKLGNVHHRQGDWDVAESHYDAALREVAATDVALQARVTADRSLNAHRRGAPTAAQRLAADARELAERAEDNPALAQAHNLLGILANARGDTDTALSHLERSLELAERLGDPAARVAALNNLAMPYAAHGRLDEAIALRTTALELCRLINDRHREAALHTNIADLLHAAGRGDDALAELKAAARLFADVGQPGVMQPEIWKLSEW